MRNLASVQKIAWKRPIEGKDRIELCGVLGWSVITKKDEFNVGDKCVYIEIDSVLPPKEEFKFLESKKYRIKTMKLGNVYSQGICFPLSILPSGDYDIGDDVTDIIGVKQYIPTMDDPKEKTSEKKASNPIVKFLMRYSWFRKLRKKNKQSIDFPSEYISKTDETRIQSCPWILKENDLRWVVTEKVDGSSGSFLLIRDRHKFKKDTFRFMVCSRNRALPTKDDSAYWFVAIKYDIEAKLRQKLVEYPDCDWIALQGEVIGPKIQKNKYKVTEPDLYIFNVITPEGRFDSISGSVLCADLGLKFVPIISAGVELPDTVDEVIYYATGESQLGKTLR